MPSSPPLVLSFAASDPTGGAGLQADVLAIAAMGCHPLSVLTALTVQDTRGVETLQPVEPRWVERQARCLLDELPVAAFKLGVLGSPENTRTVAKLLSRYAETPVVLDPVLASGRGDPLASDESVQVLREFLVPLASVVTPNSIEAQRLGGAEGLLRLGCDHVLVTGTHDSTTEVINTLYSPGGVVREDRWPRLPGSYHGSGCTLASALAAALARGEPVPQAARAAQEFTWQALRRGFRPGRGQFLPDRSFPLRELESER